MSVQKILIFVFTPTLLCSMASPVEQQEKPMLLLERLSIQLGELSRCFEGPGKQVMPWLSEVELLDAVNKAIDEKSTDPLQAIRDKTPLGSILLLLLDTYSKESFETLGVYPQFLSEKLLLLASLVKKITDLYTKDNIPVIVSYASGHLLLEYLLVATLNALGYKKVLLHTIDTLYESPRTIAMRRHIPLTTLQNKFSLATYSLDFQESAIKNLFSKFIEKLKAQNITVDHCYANWQHSEKTELHWGIWKGGADFIWAAQSYAEGCRQPLIFMTVQPSTPPYFYSKPFRIIEDLQNFLSFKVLAQKPCIDDRRCSNNSAGCKTAISNWKFIIPSGPFPPLLVLNREDPALVTQMNNLFSKLSNHVDTRAALRVLLQCRSYGAPADNPDITFYDMVTLTAADDRARAFYASLDKSGAYIQRVSSPPRSTLEFIEAIRSGPEVWYSWDGTQKKFNRIIRSKSNLK